MSLFSSSSHTSKVSIDWIVGVSLAVGANVVGNFGVQIIKIAHTKLDDKKNNQHTPSIADHEPNRKKHDDDFKQKLINDNKYNEKQQNGVINNKNSSSSSVSSKSKSKKGIKSTYICNPLWMCGFLFQLSCSLMDFGALGFAPESVVAPIGALSIVVNLICTPIFQGERANIQLIIVTIFIVIGSVITTVFSPKNHNNYKTVREIINLYDTIYFLLYAIIILIIMIILLIFHLYCKKLKKSNNIKYFQYFFKLHRFSIATLSGIMGAQNILFAKGVSTMIVFTATNAKGSTICFIVYEFYILLAAMLLSVWFQLKWLNYGLKYFSPMQIIPIFQSFWTLIGILGGLIVYQEFNDFYDKLYKYLFSAGVAIILISIWYLTTLKSTDLKQINNKKEESDTNNNESIQKNTYININNDENNLDINELEPNSSIGDINDSFTNKFRQNEQ